MKKRFGMSVGWLAAVMMAASVPAVAQYTTTGEIIGSVADDQGAALPGVVLVLKSRDLVNPLQVVTDSTGRYHFTDVRPSTYTLTSQLSGFAAPPVDVVVRVGSTTKLDLTMVPEGKYKEQVTVVAQAPQVESVTSQVNKYISFDEIQNLPLQNRQFLDVLNIVPGITGGIPTGTYNDRGPRNSFSIHGARTNQNDFLLDGASNNDKSDLNYEDIASVQVLGGPRSGNAGRAGQTFQVGTALQTYNMDAIQEVQVSTSMFSAEFGSGGSGGVINVITRSGTDVVAGSVTAQHQRDAWVSGSESQRIRRSIGSLAFGGPLVKGKTYFFGSYEYDDQKLGFDFSQPSYYVPNYLRNPNSDLTANHTKRDRLTLKVNQRFALDHNLSFTTNYINERADVLQTIFRDRSIDDAVPEFYENKSWGAILRDLAVLGDGGNFTLESVLNATNVDRNFNSSNDNPREIYNTYVPSYSSYTTGENSPDNNNTIKTLGLSEKLSWTTPTMLTKVGVGLDYFKQHSEQVEYISYYNYFYGEGSPDNSVSFLRIPPTDLSASVTDVYGFAQTDWYLNPRTTFNIGVRYQHDDLIGENTLEPRFGVAYDPSGNGTQVLRAGIGLYHDRSNLIGRTGALRPPTESGDVIDGQLVPDGLPSIVELDPNLKLPKIYKAVLGYQRQFGRNTTAGITLFANWNRDLFYTSRMNRPDKDGNRANPNLGTITYYGNFGKSDVYDLELEFRHRFGNGSMVQASYTYEDAKGNSAFDFISGNDPINRGTQYNEQMETYAVWGPLPSEIKHNVKLSGVFMLPWGFQFSTFANWHTGQPYYWYTTWYEMPAYFPHFAFYGGGYDSQTLDSYFNLDVRLAKSFKIGSYDLLIFFDGFNVTNHENILSRNQLYAYNYGAPIGEAGTVYYANYDKPTFYGPKRAAQLGFRFSF